MTGRVLVTARCRHKGHALAELLATAGGRQVIEVRGRDDPSGALAGAAGEIMRLDQGEGLGGEDSHRVTCTCGRPHLVRDQNLKTARVAGESVVVIDPMR